MTRRRVIPNTPITTHIPRDLAEEVRALLLDPLTNRTQFGGLSALVTQLLYNWVDTQRDAAAITPLSLEKETIS